jgi:hypothetical protein
VSLAAHAELLGITHGAASGWYPYDFLDVSALGYAARPAEPCMRRPRRTGLPARVLLVDRELPRHVAPVVSTPPTASAL